MDETLKLYKVVYRKKVYKEGTNTNSLDFEIQEATKYIKAYNPKELLLYLANSGANSGIVYLSSNITIVCVCHDVDKIETSV
ncbi:MAG: hypothetical protein GY797_33550 [Deltaproteobacteria bacterium]|nr:hypothetical protein [Deltaproteobacteria bacterium]